jgi:hypothetical protein
MKKPDISDNTDRFEFLDKKMENMPGGGPDKTDRFDSALNMSDLSGRPLGLLDENLRNISEIGPYISDRLDPNLNMSVLSGRAPGLLDENFSPYDEYDFEQRLSIAEYDGGQSPVHAHRIAYLDAFISALTSLSATSPQRDWLDQRIQTSVVWIEGQGFHSIN